MQRLEFARFGKKERTVTLSLFTGDDLYSVTGTVSFQDQNGSCSFATPFGAIRMYTYNSLTEFTIDVAPGKETKIQAVKLELGSFQTLAHKEGSKWVLNEIPDYATELTKCQRYQVVIRLPTWSNFPASGATGTTQNGLRVAFMIPATMQKNPTVSFEGEIYANFLKSGKIESVLIKSFVWAILDTPMSVRLALDATPTDTVYPVLSISTRDSTAKIILDSNI